MASVPNLPLFKGPFVRSAYNYDMSAASDESALHCPEPTLAVQDQRDEVDINTIVRRFGLDGRLPENIGAPTCGDFIGVHDYHTAMNAVAKANEAFEEMPASVRSRFGNDPGQFVDFCSDPKNASEMASMGLLSAEAMKARAEAEAAAKAAENAANAAGASIPAKAGT